MRILWRIVMALWMTTLLAAVLGLEFGTAPRILRLLDLALDGFLIWACLYMGKNRRR